MARGRITDEERRNRKKRAQGIKVPVQPTLSFGPLGQLNVTVPAKLKPVEVSFKASSQDTPSDQEITRHEGLVEVAEALEISLLTDPSFENTFSDEEFVDSIDKGDEDGSGEDEDTMEPQPGSPFKLSIRMKNAIKELNKVKAKLIKDGTLDCISKGNMWILPPSAAIIQSPAKRCPEAYANSPIYLLYPELMCPALCVGNAPPCPRCRSSDTVCKGYPDRPACRTVYGLEQNYYVAYRRYQCNSCYRTHKEQKAQGVVPSDCCSYKFSPFTPGFLDLLPAWLIEEIPFIATHRSAYDKLLLKIARPFFIGGGNPNSLAKMIKELHREKHSSLELQYYNKAKHAKQNHPNLLFEPFYSYSDSETWDDRTPSRSGLKSVFCKNAARLRPYMDHKQKLLSVKILKGDHSFKVMVRLCRIDGKKLYECIFTAVNEYGQIRLQTFQFSVSHEELRTSLEHMKANLDALGQNLELVYTDMCCHEDNFYYNTCLSKYRPEERSDPVLCPAGNVEDLPILPLDSPPIVVQTSDRAKSVCADILQNCSYVGFDAEWDYDRLTHLTGKLSIVQVSNVLGHSYVFQLLCIRELPREFLELLESPNILKIGRQIGGDAKKLLRDWGIKMEGLVELGTLCRVKGFVKSGSVGLAELCRGILKHRLPKPDDVRVSTQWSRPTLSLAQLEYAARDSLAGIRIYEVISTLGNAGLFLNKKSLGLLGTNVDIYHSPTGSGVVAQGTIVKVNGDNCDIRLSRILIPGAALPFANNDRTRSLAHLLPEADGSLGVVKWNTKRLKRINPGRWEPVQKVPISPNERRVKLDAFHAMKRIEVPPNHGITKLFIFRLRDALFKLDKDDCMAVATYLESQGLDWDTMWAERSDWMLQRVRRYIPEPCELHERVKKVCDTLGPMVDAKTSKPLFDEKAWLEVDKLLEHITRGCLSDPTGIDLYSVLRRDKFGLKIYHCSRGTSDVEGIHQKMILMFTSMNAGPELSCALLAEYRHRHNYRIQHTLVKDVIDCGHYSLWLIDQIQLDSAFVLGAARYRWYPVNSVVLSTETFGVRPLCDNMLVHDSLAMTIFSPDIDSNNLLLRPISSSKSIQFLVDKLGAGLNIFLPVLLSVEFHYFDSLMKKTDMSGNLVYNTNSPDFSRMSAEWNIDALELGMTKKFPSFLLRHHSLWLRRRNARLSAAGHYSEISELRHEMRSVVSLEEVLEDSRIQLIPPIQATIALPESLPPPSQITALPKPVPPPILPSLGAPPPPLIPCKPKTRQRRRCRRGLLKTSNGDLVSYWCGSEECPGRTRAEYCNTADAVFTAAPIDVLPHLKYVVPRATVEVPVSKRKPKSCKVPLIGGGTCGSIACAGVRQRSRCDNPNRIQLQ